MAADETNPPPLPVGPPRLTDLIPGVGGWGSVALLAGLTTFGVSCGLWWLLDMPQTGFGAIFLPLAAAGHGLAISAFIAGYADSRAKRAARAQLTDLRQPSEEPSVNWAARARAQCREGAPTTTVPEAFPPKYLRQVDNWNDELRRHTLPRYALAMLALVPGFLLAAWRLTPDTVRHRNYIELSVPLFVGSLEAAAIGYVIFAREQKWRQLFADWADEAEARDRRDWTEEMLQPPRQQHAPNQPANATFVEALAVDPLPGQTSETTANHQGPPTIPMPAQPFQQNSGTEVPRDSGDDF